MFDFDRQYIQVEGSIHADALIPIYDGMDADKILDQDYLLGEGNYINTDTFLPNDPPSTQYIPYPIPKHIPFTIATLDPSTTPLVIPTSQHENTDLEELKNYLM